MCLAYRVQDAPVENSKLQIHANRLLFGPSAMINPIRENISMISFLTIDNGCLVPNSIADAVRVKSISSFFEAAFS